MPGSYSIHLFVDLQMYFNLNIPSGGGLFTDDSVSVVGRYFGVGAL